MKGESFFSVYVSVPRERKNVTYLGPISKDGDRSMAVFSLELNAPTTAKEYGIFSD